VSGTSCGLSGLVAELSGKATSGASDVTGTGIVGGDTRDDNDGMAILGGSDPAEARTPAEYVGLLRRLKEDSGLTFRQLEERAAEHGDVLARSTLADVLRRDGLPRAEVVAALVRACGAEEEVPRWLAARERLAEGERLAVAERAVSEAAVPEAAVPEAAVPESDRVPAAAPAVGSRTRTASLAALASLGTVVLLVIAAVVLLPDDEGGAGDAEGSMNPAATPVPRGPDPGWSRIRPLRAPELCLTEGEARVDGETKVVAVQRPCAEAVPPRTSLQRADDGLYFIKWWHPDEGTGCLTVLDEGPFRGMLEPWPWKNCRAGNVAQRFRIERAEGGRDHWRLRPEPAGERCVGVRDGAGGADAPGAVAVAQRCTGQDGDGQVFLIGPE
jgi:hypothetical protein